MALIITLLGPLWPLMAIAVFENLYSPEKTGSRKLN